MADVIVTFVTTLRAHSVNYSTALIANSTAHTGSDETSAAWYIFTVIGFFGIVMFSLMVSNLIVNRGAEEADPYFQYIEKQAKKKATIRKLGASKFLTFANKGKKEHPNVSKGEDMNATCSEGVEEQHGGGNNRQQEEGPKEQQGERTKVQQEVPNEAKDEEPPQGQAVDPDSLYEVAVKS
ncbi:uncharacterized protein LOC144771548 [Lissotriton helveticus]